MITRLEVDGFKSLRDFAIDLEPFTVLVGPNDAGKSNILEAIALAAVLDRMPPEEALKQGRGTASDKFWRHGRVTSSTIVLALECLDWGSTDHLRWANRERYELSFERVARSTRTERIELSEKVTHIPTESDRWLHAHPEWNDDVLPVSSHALASVDSYLPSFALLQLSASHLREPSDRIDSGELAPDASNLPSVLAALPDDKLGQIRGALAGLIPGISDFDITEHQENLHIEFRTREGERVPARLASDGTLRMLGLLTAVIARPPVSENRVICIEEPENGIYPARLARLLDLLRELTDVAPWRADEADSPPLQIILTTHSPVALGALKRHPEALRFIDPIRRDGVRFTRARRIGDGDRLTHVSMQEIDLRLQTSTSEER